MACSQGLMHFIDKTDKVMMADHLLCIFHLKAVVKLEFSGLGCP